MSINKIVCWNVNGLRALKPRLVLAKGSMEAFFDSLDAEIIVFQETKVGSAIKDIEDGLLHVKGYESFWSICKKKPGYSGVVTYVKIGLTVNAKTEFGTFEFDTEGRVMMTDHGSFLLFNVYFPNSGQGDRLEYKMNFYKWFEGICDGYIAEGRNLIVAGDVNTTHQALDIWTPQKLVKGLFMEERKWMDHMFNVEEKKEAAWIDCFRHFHPTSQKYTWWDIKQNQRSVDLGYRIDYFMTNVGFISQITDSEIMTQQLGSDHCPLYLLLKPQTVPPVQGIPNLSSEKIKKSQTRISIFFTVASKTKATVEPIKQTAESSGTHQTSSAASTVLEITSSTQPAPLVTGADNGLAKESELVSPQREKRSRDDVYGEPMVNKEEQLKRSKLS